MLGNIPRQALIYISRGTMLIISPSASVSNSVDWFGSRFPSQSKQPAWSPVIALLFVGFAAPVDSRSLVGPMGGK